MTLQNSAAKPDRELGASQGLDPDPMAAYDRSGYDERIVAERVGGTQAGWGA